MQPYQRRYEGDFARSIRCSPSGPIVISEGDSWFDYPFYRNVVTWLDDPRDTGDPGQQNAWRLMRLERCGDEVCSMLAGRQRTILATMVKRYEVEAILFSGGGNDIVGPELLPLLVPVDAEDPGVKPADCVHPDRLERRLRQIRDAYLDLIDLADEAKRPMTIYAHCYDYAPPSNEGVSVLGVFKAGPWMLPYMLKQGIKTPSLQLGVVRLLIDAFYDMLASLPNVQNQVTFRVIDTRNTIQGRWCNEIHPDRDGFRSVASKYAAALRQQFPSSRYPNFNLDPL